MNIVYLTSVITNNFNYQVIYNIDIPFQAYLPYFFIFLSLFLPPSPEFKLYSLPLFSSQSPQSKIQNNHNEYDSEISRPVSPHHCMSYLKGPPRSSWAHSTDSSCSLYLSHSEFVNWHIASPRRIFFYTSPS